MIGAEVVAVLKDAWAPFLGHELAEERARDAATILIAGDRPLTPERVSDVLTSCFVRASQPMYGGKRFSGSTVIDAVNDAIEALAAAGGISEA